MRGNFLLLVAQLAREKIQELRPFIPPVAEQLRVIRRDDDGRPVQQRRDLPRLREAFVEKMPRVPARRRERMVALIDLLLAARR